MSGVLPPFCLVDAHGEVQAFISGSSVANMVRSVQDGHHLIVEPHPGVDAWWSFDAVAWLEKPPQPSADHYWAADVKSWVDRYTPADRQRLAMDALRVQRDRELARSDLVALRALEALMPPQIQEWRQALRDLPATVTDPTGPIDWPADPAGD